MSDVIKPSPRASLDAATTVPADMMMIPRSTLEEVMRALSISVETIVALEGIFEVADDGLSHGLTEAAGLCVAYQSDSVTEAHAAVSKLLNAN